MHTVSKKSNENPIIDLMATKHYLSFLQETMRRRWNCIAWQDLDGVNKYTYAELAEAIKRLHVTYCALWT